jgi:hypothetical protein
MQTHLGAIVKDALRVSHAQPVECVSQDLSPDENEAYFQRMSTVVRLAKILLIVFLAILTISFVIGVARPETGAIEKSVLLALIAGCVVLAAKVSTLAARAQERLLQRR